MKALALGIAYVAGLAAAALLFGASGAGARQPCWAHNTCPTTTGTTSATTTAPTADLSSLTDPYQRMVTSALETYGAYLGDAGGSNMMSFAVESVSDGSSYPFTQLSLPKAITDQLVVLAP